MWGAFHIWPGTYWRLRPRARIWQWRRPCGHRGLGCSFLEGATLQQRRKLGGRGQRAGAEAGASALLFPAVSLCHASMTWPVHTQPGQQAWKELLRLFTKMDDDLRWGVRVWNKTSLVTKTWRKHGSKQWFPGRPLRRDFLAAPPPRCPWSSCRRHSPFLSLAHPQASRTPREVCEGTRAASSSRVSSVCRPGSEPHSYSSAVGWGLRRRLPPPRAFRRACCFDSLSPRLFCAAGFKEVPANLGGGIHISSVLSPGAWVGATSFYVGTPCLCWQGRPRFWAVSHTPGILFAPNATSCAKSHAKLIRQCPGENYSSISTVTRGAADNFCHPCQEPVLVPWGWAVPISRGFSLWPSSFRGLQNSALSVTTPLQTLSGTWNATVGRCCRESLIWSNVGLMKRCPYPPPGQPSLTRAPTALGWCIGLACSYLLLLRPPQPLPYMGQVTLALPQALDSLLSLCDYTSRWGQGLAILVTSECWQLVGTPRDLLNDCRSVSGPALRTRLFLCALIPPSLCQ